MKIEAQRLACETMILCSHLSLLHISISGTFVPNNFLPPQTFALTQKNCITEKNNARNVLRRAVDTLEKQYQNLEGVAAQITASADCRPSAINSGPVYDIERLKAFRQFANYSPLARQDFSLNHQIKEKAQRSLY